MYSWFSSDNLIDRMTQHCGCRPTWHIPRNLLFSRFSTQSKSVDLLASEHKAHTDALIINNGDERENSKSPVFFHWDFRDEIPRTDTIRWSSVNAPVEKTIPEHQISKDKLGKQIIWKIWSVWRGPVGSFPGPLLDFYFPGTRLVFFLQLPTAFLFQS